MCRTKQLIEEIWTIQRAKLVVVQRRTDGTKMHFILLPALADSRCPDPQAGLQLRMERD